MAEDTSTGAGTPAAGATTDAAKPVADGTTTSAAATTTSTDTAKPADAKPDATTEAAKPAAPVVPEKYDLKLPEASTLDPAVLERTAATARELGLSNEHAQKALELVNAEVAAREAAVAEQNKPGGEAWNARVTQWETAALADPEIGGTPEKLQANVAQAKKLLGTFGDEQLTTFLHDTGFGSHPLVLRLFARLAKGMGEGQIISPNDATIGRKSDEELFYGKTTEQA